MKTRQEIKSAAKEAMAQQRGTSIMVMVFFFAVAFIWALLLGISMPAPTIGAMGVTVTPGLVYWLIYIVGMIAMFVLEVNLIGEYIKIYKGETASAGEIFSGLQVRFPRKLGGMLWMALFLMLWMLLFAIPAIIVFVIFFSINLMPHMEPYMTDPYAFVNDPYMMAYVVQDLMGEMVLGMVLMWVVIFIPLIVKLLAYFFTVNILADCPNVTATQALKISMKITKGHRWQMFVFILSFIGWWILSAFTLFILAVVYVGPYFYTAYAGLYLELKNKALADGVITYEELGEEPPAEDKPDFFAIDEGN